MKFHICYLFLEYTGVLLHVMITVGKTHAHPNIDQVLIDKFPSLNFTNFNDSHLDCRMGINKAQDSLV